MKLVRPLQTLVNIAGQLDYFLKGTAESSPYFFGSVGVLEGSGSGANPVSAGVGGAIAHVSETR